MSRLGIGIVGCGEVARKKHGVALRGVPGVRVVACADEDPAAARALAEEFQARVVTSTELFGREDIDLIAVLTPPATHAELAIAAMRAGKHVLIEKPLTLDAAEARELLQVAGETGRHAAVSFHLRFHRLIRQAKTCLQQGVLGELQGIRFSWCSPRPPRPSPWKDRRITGGGALIELGVHGFDLFEFLTGSPVREVQAHTVNGRREDETATVLARLENGVVCSALYSEVSTHKIELELHGTRGRLQVDCLRFDGLERLRWGEDPGSPALRVRSVLRTLRELPVGLDVWRRGGDYLLSFQTQWNELAAAVAAGDAPECGLESGLRSTEALQAALSKA